MITILTRLLIKNREQVGEPAVRRAYGMLCSLVGIGLNVILFAGKYLAGRMSGSIAVTADAFNNLSDAGSSFMTLVGFQVGGKIADAGHPFGHGRGEYVSGFCVSMAIILMGIELLQSSVEKVLHPEAVDTGLLSVGILLVSIGVKVYMAFYNRRIGEKIQSEAMKAASIDSLSDCIATGTVLFSVLVTYFTGMNIDGWCGCLVACFVLWAGVKAARETLDPILGEPPSKEFVKQVEDMVLAHPEIKGIHDLVVHDYGPGRRMISLHGEVSGDSNLFVIHAVIDGIERELKSKLGCEAVIHMDPLETENAAIFQTKRELAKMIGERFPGVTIHDFRVVCGAGCRNLIFDAVVPYDYGKSNEEVRRGIESLVREKWDDSYAIVEVEQSYV